MTSVLVLRALGLGDLLTAVPALRGVRRAHPWARLVVAAPASLGPLLDLVGGIDAVVDTGPFVTRAPTGTLAVDPPDVAVNFHGRGPQSTELLRATQARHLVSYGVTSRWCDDEHEVDRWCRLATEAGMPADPADLDLAVPPVASPAPGAVVVHPGAAYGGRRWPADRWGVVAAALAAAGHRVVVTGGAAERRLAESVAAAGRLRPDSVLAGHTDIASLAALVAGAGVVVSGDTGIAHLASAYRTPSVVLFGPTPPARWGPPARPQHRVLWGGRVGNPFADEPGEGLLAIDPTAVLDAVAAVLPV